MVLADSLLLENDWTSITLYQQSDDEQNRAKQDDKHAGQNDVEYSFYPVFATSELWILDVDEWQACHRACVNAWTCDVREGWRNH